MCNPNRNSGEKWRIDLAQAICDSLQEHRGWTALVVDLKCPDCGWYLIEIVGQDIAFCWGCTTDRRCAQTGHTILERLRMAERGYIIGGDHTHENERYPL